MPLKKYKKNEHNLPVPRLQLRIKAARDGNYQVTYSMIKETMRELKELVIHNSDYSMSLHHPSENKPLHSLRPHNSLCEIMIDMWTLRLPAYIVSNESYEELTFDNLILKINNKVWDIMEKDLSRKEEYDRLQKLSKDTIAKMKEDKALVELAKSSLGSALRNKTYQEMIVIGQQIKDNTLSEEF